MNPNSARLFEEARQKMPGGVNSPVRSFAAVGGAPPYIASGVGAHLTDEDGRVYTDFVLSWGPLILGHAHPLVVEKVRQAAERGLSFGACHKGEVELANEIQGAMPHLEMLRLVNSGTEAAMSALRLARAATGRDKFIKFEGCYHGHADSFLVAAGSGALTLGRPSSPGVTQGVSRDTLVARYNDLKSVGELFAAHQDIAAVFVEPVAANMGVVAPEPGFLEGLRALCGRHGALLVFDEVITGFRLGLGGAAGRFHVVPDLTVLGKIIGGGLPMGAYGGRRDLMRQVAPEGPVYQAGTLSGNPLACAAGAATLRVLREENPYALLESLSDRLEQGLRSNLKRWGGPAAVNRVASLLTCFYGIPFARSFEEVKACDTRTFGRCHAALLEEGFYLPPSAFEAMFLCTAHSEDDLDGFLEAHWRALSGLEKA